MKNNQNILILCFSVLIVVLVVHHFTKNLILKPVDGRISSPFGMRQHPIEGIEKFHNGIDIAAPSGTPIRAPFSGKIHSVFYNAKGGNSIIMLRNDGLHAGFAHLSEFKVKEGQKVKTGEIIGKVGSTGNSTGPHLHLTVKDRHGEYLDPQKLIV